MQFKVEQSEWETVKIFLADSPNGTKLPYSAIKKVEDGKVIAKPRAKRGFFDLIEKYKSADSRLNHTFHSFIKINNVIYAIAQGKTEAIIGKGTYGKCKYIYDEQGKVYVLKIEDYKNIDEKELTILQDLNLSQGRHPIKYHNEAKYPEKIYQKSAMQMEYLGESLVPKLSSMDLPDQFDLGIKISIALYDLHQKRSKSQRGLAYGHRDLHIGNITIDKHGQVHLIDFGWAEPNPKKKSLGLNPEDLSIETIEQKDVYDLISILKDILKENMIELRDTDRSLSAFSIAAHLIKAKYKLSISNEELKDIPKALALITLYEMHSQNMSHVDLQQEMEACLKITNKIKLMSTIGFMNLTKHLDYFEENEFQNLQSHETCCVFAHFKMLNIHYPSSLDAEKITAIFALITASKALAAAENVKKIFSDMKLAKTINILYKKNFQECFTRVINSKILPQAIEEASDEQLKSLPRLVSNKNLIDNDETLIYFLKNPRSIAKLLYKKIHPKCLPNYINEPIALRFILSALIKKKEDVSEVFTYLDSSQHSTIMPLILEITQQANLSLSKNELIIIHKKIILGTYLLTLNEDNPVIMSFKVELKKELANQHTDLKIFQNKCIDLIRDADSKIDDLEEWKCWSYIAHSILFLIPIVGTIISSVSIGYKLQTGRFLFFDSKPENKDLTKSYNLITQACK